MNDRIRHPLIALLAAAVGVSAPMVFAAPQSGLAYMGYTGTQWGEDHGITRGRCDTKAVSDVLAASSTDPDALRVAILSGIDLAPVDRGCAAHALELLRNHRTVRWNAGSGPHSLTTGGDTVANGLPCRPFILVTRGRKVLGTACQAQPGVWEVLKP